MTPFFLSVLLMNRASVMKVICDFLDTISMEYNIREVLFTQRSQQKYSKYHAILYMKYYFIHFDMLLRHNNSFSTHMDNMH